MKYFIIGIICLVVSLIFGLFCVVSVTIPLANGGITTGWGANITNAGASLGFAIAGGLSIFASALVNKKSE